MVVIALFWGVSGTWGEGPVCCAVELEFQSADDEDRGKLYAEVLSEMVGVKEMV